MIEERLSRLRDVMKRAGVDCCLIPTSDYHDSEYVSDFFAVRRYFSGFTGSAGTLIVTESEAALFTDGRYFIQAGRELAGTQIQLMKMGEPEVPSIKEYLEKVLHTGQTLGFDGRVIPAKEAQDYEAILKRKQGRIVWDMDPAEGIWKDRPHLPANPVYILEECYCGESVEKKLARVREQMKERGADVHILTTLDDIAWLFNLRGSDVDYCPVFLAYAVIRMDEALLFADKSEVSFYLKENKVTLRPYSDIYDYTARLHGEKALVCRERINYRLYKTLAGDMEVVDGPNPTALMKAVKNQVEIENLRKAHLKDAVAVTRFMFWLKRNVGEIPMTEVSAGEYLEQLRREQANFIEPSFETICAYGANGAIIHYSAKVESCAELKPQGLLMVDSGGHYSEGSTDITRTFVLGPVTAEMKYHFTLVLRSMMRLYNTRFLYGCRGFNLDIRAREVLWEQGLDYKHGTGHGVGYLLNVHEGPNSFRWNIEEGRPLGAVLEEGMVTTDEPGIYIEGSHGIRLENELLCRKDEKNEFGQFMCFENLTWVPIDLDGVNVNQLTEQEREWLNDYHRQVCEKLTPFFEGKELAWLEEATREI
ncbi:MAG: aminopeptidase P family protein [Lachnospiraceae bacterium]|nr:aminopeptidase P family protein [Lachnospiraceae bacterium]